MVRSVDNQEAGRRILMRRWQAIVLAALALVAGSYGGITTTSNVHAGGAPFTVSVDCDTSTGAIEAACTYPGGTTSVDVDVYITNNSTAAQLASFNVSVTSAEQFFVPTAPGSCTAPKKNCNPDFDEGVSGEAGAATRRLPISTAVPPLPSQSSRASIRTSMARPSQTAPQSDCSRSAIRR